MAQHQLAIIDANDKGASEYCKDTVTMHVVSGKFRFSPDNVYPFKEFSLLDDAQVKCKPQVTYEEDEVRYYFEIGFTTSVPKSYQYEISLYCFDKLNKLIFSNDLKAENIRQHKTFRLLCKKAFLVDPSNNVAYANEIDGNIILYSKISRKDIPYALHQKSALHQFSQRTDSSLLFENEALSNLTISVKSREFKVHKEILAAKSSVFLAMFETDMKEKKEKHVEIEDMEANIFQEFLRYIYTDTVNDLNAHADKLYVAADKYDLPKLKSMCVDKLSTLLNVENASHIFSFADENSVTILKERTIDFIKKHMELIFQTEGYKTLYQSPKAYLIHEIFKATFDYNNTLK